MNQEPKITPSDVDADIEKMTHGARDNMHSEFNSMDTSPESLMDRYAKQESIQKMQAQNELRQLEEEIEVHTTIIPSPVATSIPKDPPLQQPVTKSNLGLSAQIAELEAQLHDANYVDLRGSTSTNARSFLDDLGDETFFIENISNGHVQLQIGNEDMKVQRGAISNLLKFNSLEEIKSSRDLKVALAVNLRSPALLRRLTPEEYMSKLEQKINNEKKIEHYRKVSQLRAQAGQAESVNTQETTRPIILDKINKLKLGYSEEFHKGITPVEFAEWINTENLTKNELDLILGHIDDQDLRILINEKKKSLIESNFRS